MVRPILVVVLNACVTLTNGAGFLLAQAGHEGAAQPAGRGSVWSFARQGRSGARLQSVHADQCPFGWTTNGMSSVRDSPGRQFLDGFKWKPEDGDFLANGMVSDVLPGGWGGILILQITCETSCTKFSTK